jgi:hypothetical protein
MKLAVMQPYLFPYIGYFQLINAVDKFVIYDDVNFIKQGWINKNKILVNNNSFSFVLSLENSSSYKKINETRISLQKYQFWKTKLYKTIEQAYTKAPFYNEVIILLKKILDTNYPYISTLNTLCIIEICKYLNIETEIIPTSTIYKNETLTGQSRIIEICKIEKADIYVNMIGGKELYNYADFLNQGILIKFLTTNEIYYKQFNDRFLPFLSIIDIMMFNNKNQINKFLNKYNFTEKND